MQAAYKDFKSLYTLISLMLFKAALNRKEDGIYLKSESFVAL